MLSGKVHVDGLCEVGDLSCDHVGGQVRQELFAAVLAAEPCRVLSHLTPAVDGHARWVEDAVIVLDAGHIAVQEEEVVLIGVILVT